MTPSTDLFQELRGRMDEPQLRDPDGFHLTTGYSNSAGELRIFQDLSGRIGLFIPLGELDPPSVGPDRESRAITLQMFPRQNPRVAELRLENSALESVFHVFVDTYFKNFGSDPERAASIGAAQLKRWRALFLPVPPNSLSESDEIGLLCELQEMELLLDTEGDAAFYRWTGPDRQAHDFRFDDRGVECKATRISDGLHVTVNGARQMSTEPGRRLMLVVRKYEPSPNGEIALSEVVRNLVNDDRIPSDEFLRKLSATGFSLPGVDEQRENRYRMIDRNVFEIGPGFPRILLEDPSDRIGDVSYSIDLTPPEDIPGFREDGSTL